MSISAELVDYISERQPDPSKEVATRKKIGDLVLKGRGSCRPERE
jgi:hypothetical protein